jgi:hypothetical protein
LYPRLQGKCLSLSRASLYGNSLSYLFMGLSLLLALFAPRKLSLSFSHFSAPYIERPNITIYLFLCNYLEGYSLSLACPPRSNETLPLFELSLASTDYAAKLSTTEYIILSVAEPGSTQYP